MPGAPQRFRRHLGGNQAEVLLTCNTDRTVRIGELARARGTGLKLAGVGEPQVHPRHFAYGDHGRRLFGVQWQTYRTGHVVAGPSRQDGKDSVGIRASGRRETNRSVASGDDQHSIGWQ